MGRTIPSFRHGAEIERESGTYLGILFLKSFLRMNYYQLSQIALPHNKYDGLTLRSSLWSITWVGYIT